ncbi:putative Major facilitator superfamily (MFS) profile domain-containing protein [Seiridium unicorne]|uniref:Major facilitator superfamily (MFS) profile domain-containing protein n=1 Tax=Seiridium unicorne TaxID=138068 RepID=A0ABR2VCG1_9PEZI
MAYGIMWSAAGFGGVVLPLLRESVLLNIYGFQNTMRIWAGILAAFPVLGNNASEAVRYAIRSLSDVCTPLAEKCCSGVRLFLTSDLPALVCSILARSIKFMSALTVLLLSIAATMGSIMMGTLTDRLHVTTCITMSIIGTATGVFLIWGLSSSLPVLCVFCIVYGFFARGWTSIWPGIMRGMARQGESMGHYVDPTMVLGWLCVGRGDGNIVSGPLGDSLLIGGKAWIGHVGAGWEWVRKLDCLHREDSIGRRKQFCLEMRWDIAESYGLVILNNTILCLPLSMDLQVP